MIRVDVENEAGEVGTVIWDDGELRVEGALPRADKRRLRASLRAPVVTRTAGPPGLLDGGRTVSTDPLASESAFFAALLECRRRTDIRVLWRTATGLPSVTLAP